MAENIWYHVFFESNDKGIGYYLGSFKEREIAREKGEDIWDYFHGDITDKTQEIIEASKFWIRYQIFPETEYSHIVFFGVLRSSGLSSLLAIQSKEPDFVYKYIEFRGTTQIDLFPKQPYELCVMFQFELKRQIAQKKLLRRHRVLESRNIIIINSHHMPLDSIQGISMFWCQEIEVTQRFFDEMEYTDVISISNNDDNIKKEIPNFDNYFRNEVVLKARCYNEKTNILYFDLVGMQ